MSRSRSSRLSDSMAGLYVCPLFPAIVFLQRLNRGILLTDGLKALRGTASDIRFAETQRNPEAEEDCNSQSQSEPKEERSIAFLESPRIFVEFAVDFVMTFLVGHLDFVTHVWVESNSCPSSANPHQRGRVSA